VAGTAVPVGGESWRLVALTWASAPSGIVIVMTTVRAPGAAGSAGAPNREGMMSSTSQ
jgi:hypothetical protein